MAVGVNPWIDLPGSAGVPPAQGLARWKKSLQTRIWCALQGSGPGWQVVCRYRVRARRPRSQGGTFRTQTGAAATHRTSTPSSGVPTPLARTDSTSSESVDSMVVTAVGDLVHCTVFSDPSRGGGNAGREERPPGSAGVPPAQGLARWKKSLQTRIWCALQGSGPGWQVVCRYRVRARRPRSQGGTAPFRVYCVKDVPGFYPRIAPPSRRSRRSRAARRRQMRWGCKPGPRAPAQGSSRAA